MLQILCGSSRCDRVRRLPRLLAPVAVLAVLWTGGPPAAAQEPTDLTGVIERAIQGVYPALVRLHVISVMPNGGREVKRESSGSGVVISPEGYVITNHHVAARAERLECVFADKQRIEATLVGTDPLADIAVLRLKLDQWRKGVPLPVAKFGDSSALKVGDRVLAMGSPLALSQSVTLGIVSNVEMTFPDLLWPASFRLDGEETGSLVRWIGHDAQISPGNSGGPLVNLAGEIVGINEISFGLSGAIPGNLAREVAEQLMREGDVRRSFLGLELQPLLRSSAAQHGALVSGVVAGSAAKQAGLQAGDILLSYAGEPVDVRYAEQLPALNRRLLGTPVGSEVDLTYERDGRVLHSRVRTVARGHAQADDAELSSWGATLRDLTLLQARELDREPNCGVLVSSVRPGGPSAEAKPPLAPWDIVVEVAGQPVHNLDELRQASQRSVAESPTAVPTLVAFDRRGERFLTVVRIGKERERDTPREATKAWLPVDTQVLTRELAAALNLAGRTGVRVTQLHPHGATDALGLRVGDILLRLDGEPIAASRPEDSEVFAALIRERRIGSKATLEMVRDGQPLTLGVELQPSPPTARDLVEYRDTLLEFQARDLTDQDRINKELDGSQKGALVSGVENGGWAAVAHLAVGDIVLAVDGEPVLRVDDLKARLQAVAAGKPPRVVFLVRRGVHTLYLEIEPAWK